MTKHAFDKIAAGLREVIQSTTVDGVKTGLVVASWDGLPLNPERDGVHWVRLFGDTEPTAILWYAKPRAWTDLGGAGWPPPAYADAAEYLGPVMTPAERDALRAEAFSLAATQCAAPVMGEYGHMECSALKAALARAAWWRDRCIESDCRGVALDEGLRGVLRGINASLEASGDRFPHGGLVAAADDLEALLAPASPATPA